MAFIKIYLAQYWPALALHGSGAVLVPLCGKTLDMTWLAAQGHEVLGVELSEKAVRAYFAEQGLLPQVRTCGAFTCFSSGRVNIYCGDFLLLRPLLARCVACFDRAALIALPEAMRLICRRCARVC